MPAHLQPAAPLTAAFFDLGSNAVRMTLARLDQDGQIRVLAQRRRALRLGAGAFGRDRRLSPAAMRRTVRLCRQWTRAARRAGVGHIAAVATAAARGLRNRLGFVRRLRAEAGLPVRVLTGTAEARLMYRGLRRNLPPGARQALFLDIGGGSTQLAVGSRSTPACLLSLDLGAVRLARRLPPTAPAPPELYARLRNEVRARAKRRLGAIHRRRPQTAVGAGGTILALATVALRRRGRVPHWPATVRTSRIRRTIRRLAAMPLARRRRVPGLQPDRADIIIAGGAILETLLEELRIEKLVVSDCGLRDGLAAELEEQLAARGRQPPTRRPASNASR